MTVADRLAERALRFGPLPADEVLDDALYGEGGFYASGGGAGRGGADFLTSPEVGPLFGAVVARWLDQRWRDLEEPDAFAIVEAAAGAGTLCRAVLAAKPECLPALRYVCVERSAALRERATSVLPAEPPSQALAGHTPGPTVTVVEDLPAGPVVGVVLANELLDNLPPVLLERSREGWSEVRVDHALAEVLVPATPDLVAVASRHAPDAAVGARIPVQRRARRWVQRARSVLEAGTVLCVDYADTTASMASRPFDTWFRTYRAHGRGGPWLDDLGAQDVTCDVAVDQLDADHVVTQADWLRANGLDALVDEARAAWQAAATRPDLAALKARSRVGEGSQLTAPAGLGGFAVLTWER